MEVVPLVIKLRGQPEDVDLGLKALKRVFHITSVSRKRDSNDGIGGVHVFENVAGVKE